MTIERLPGQQSDSRLEKNTRKLKSRMPENRVRMMLPNPIFMVPERLRAVE
jgi:hypothetical protein